MTARRCGRGCVQILMVLAALAAYMVLRVVVEGDPADAAANAELVLEVERAVGLDWEHVVQDQVLAWDSGVTAANFVYKWLYWPTIAGALALLAFVDRQGYLHLRNALVLSAAIGIAIFAVFPVAPPRFVPGYVDTLALRGERVFEGDTPWTNAYAAIPSFHVGWTVLAGVVVARRLRSRRITRLALLPGALTAVAVVATGNHWLVDGMVGLAVVAVAYRVTQPADSHAPPRPEQPETAREPILVP